MSLDGPAAHRVAASTEARSSPATVPCRSGRGAVLLDRAGVEACPHWARAFASLRKDRRYYELVEDTIEGFEHRYLAIRNAEGEVFAIQPCFLLQQDLLAGGAGAMNRIVARIRQLWPRFLTMRTLMIGCVAGEGHLDAPDRATAEAIAHELGSSILSHARDLGAGLVVFKEFPAADRGALAGLLDRGFARVPSMPLVELSIDYASFDDYVKQALSKKTRLDLRKKFKATTNAPPITMTMLTDISPMVDEVYPLYLRQYDRSKLHFEKLTTSFLCEIGRRMPDKVRFFVWRHADKLIAFSLCMLEGDAVWAEYIGLDDKLAHKLHLYHYAFRDVVSWAMANGYKRFRSSGLNYDPKYHLRFALDPIDLYVRHTSPVVNAALRRLLPYLEPVHQDPMLKKFANYAELWG